MLAVFQYPKCSTCRKAIKSLDSQGLRYSSRDLVADKLSQAELQDLWQRSKLPIAKFFNTSGVSYREGGFGAKLKTMTEEQALAALAADGKLVKRPILDTGNAVLVGFDEAAYKSLAASSK